MCSLSATIKSLSLERRIVQAINAVQQRKAGRRNFALCSSCFWSATILHEEKEVSCPVCAKGVSLIPLAKDEGYRLKISPAAGVEVSFSRA
jgi:hypothetical protein